MKLTMIDRKSVYGFLKKCNVSKAKVSFVKMNLGKSNVGFGVDNDKLFTIVKVGERYGVAKRMTYGNKPDKYSTAIGFTIALFRALFPNRPCSKKIFN